MHLEVEAKVQVDELEPVRDRLQAVGATCRGATSELNLLFDCIDPGKRRRLRLRLTDPVEGSGVEGSGSSEAILTFKGKRIKSPLKSRPEIEVTIRDTVQMQHLLNAIGYRLRFQYQKRRESWMLGATSVALDELPHLGSFVEVENSSEGDVFATLRLLGLSELPIIRRGYGSLLRRHLSRSGLDTARACFASALQTA